MSSRPGIAAVIIETCISDCTPSLRIISIPYSKDPSVNFVAMINSYGSEEVSAIVVDELKQFLNGPSGQWLFNQVLYYSQDILVNSLEPSLSELPILDYLKAIVYNLEVKVIKTLRQHSEHRNALEKQISQSRNIKDKLPFLTVAMRTDDIATASSCTIVCALVCQGQVYLANIGCSHCVVAKTNDPTPISLTTEHSLNTPIEVNRLEMCGMDFNAQLQFAHTLPVTRCIGNLELKERYRQHENMSHLTCSPVNAETEVNYYKASCSHGTYLLVASEGLVRFITSFAHSAQKVDTYLTALFNETMASLGGDKVSGSTNRPANVSLSRIAKQMLDTVVVRHQEMQRSSTCILPPSVPYGRVGLVIHHLELPIQPQSVAPLTPSEEFRSELLSPAKPSAESKPGGELLESSSSGDASVDSDKLEPIDAYVDFSEWNEAVERLSSADLEELRLLSQPFRT